MNPTLDLSEITQNIGRLFIGGMPGTKLDEDTVNLIKDFHLGGIILFKRNVSDPLQLAQLCKDLQAISIEHSGYPLFLAIDQEGGRVARLKKPFTEFPGNTAIGNSPDPEASALQFARTTAAEMSLVGLNMNMAPVLDVAQPNLDSHLVGRCFSDTPLLVTSLGEIVITTLQEAGIMAVGKHFPGLGRANMDPHLDLPTINATLEEMESIHLPPFAGAIEAHVSAIMSSHAVYPALEPGIPATVSTTIITHLLREKMGFDGLIISDDLEMGAIANERGVPEGAADALAAGVDLLLVCSRQADLIASIRLIRDKLLEGAISFDRLETSSERVRNCKDRFLSPLKRISLKGVKTHFDKGVRSS